MAEFGTQATTLTPGQGAGAQPLQGVQEAPSTFQFPGAVAEVAEDGITQWLGSAKKGKYNSIFSAYQKELAGVAAGIDSGQIRASEGNARIRSIGTKYAAQYSEDPELITGFAKIKEAVTGVSSLQNAADAAKRGESIIDGQIAKAQAQGFYIPADATEKELEPVLRASQTLLRAQEETQMRLRLQGEDRAARAEGRAIDEVAAKERDAENKRQGQRMVTEIASTGFEAAAALPRSIRDRIASGKMTPEEGMLEIDRFSQITNAQLTAVAGMNDDLARPWRQLFDDLAKTSRAFIDPKANLETLENQFKLQMTQAKLLAIADPEVKALAVVDQLLPNTAVMTLATAPKVQSTILRLASTAPGTPGFRPEQVVAGPSKEVEKATYQTTKEALKNMQAGNVKDMPKAVEQSRNLLNNILTQTGKLSGDTTIRDVDLKDITGFIASPEMAYAVKQGLISPEAAQGARNTWQIGYQQSVVKGVQAKLNANVPTDAITPGAQLAGVMDSGAAANMKLADMVDVQFSGAGVRFVPKAGSNISGRIANSGSTTSEINTMTTAVNQLIQAGAHLEGTTDYQKYWEDNKFRILPDYFADPGKLKEGDVKSGWKYKGGNTRDRNNWEKVSE